MAIEFSSPGAAFSKAMQEQLLLRLQLQRQEEQDQLEREKFALTKESTAADIERGKNSDTRADKASALAQSAFDLSQTTADRQQVNQVVEDAGADTQLQLNDPLTAKVKEQRPDRIASETKAEQGAYLGDDENQIPQYNVLPGVVKLQPGAKFEMQADNAKARKEANDAAIAGRAEAERIRSADREADSKRDDARAREIGALTAGFRSQGLAIQQQAQDLRADAAAGKKVDAAKVAKNVEDSVKSYNTSLMRLSNDLIDPSKLTLPEGKKKVEDLTDEDIAAMTPDQVAKIMKPALKSTVGTFDGIPIVGGIAAALTGNRSNRERGKSAIDSLAAVLDVDLILDMKSQSRTGATGFGALSERELGVIEAAASRLRATQLSDADYAKEVLRIYAAAARITGYKEANSLRGKYDY